MQKICPVCGVVFIDNKHPEKITCSYKCSGIARRSLKDSICEQCGKTFNAGGSPRFCSRECYDNFRTESRPICEHCGKRVPRNGTPAARRKRCFCSQECKVLHLKPKPRPCVNCGAIIVPIKFMAATGKFIAHNAGKTCSAKCQNEWIRNNPERKAKISAAFTGNLHPNWQGGKSAFNNTSNRGTGWSTVSEKARKRDKYTCQLCGMTQEENGRKLDVHHIVPYHVINHHSKANKMSNLISLCQSCHTKEEHKIKMTQMLLPFAVIAKASRVAARAELKSRM